MPAAHANTNAPRVPAWSGACPVGRTRQPARTSPTPASISDHSHTPEPARRHMAFRSATRGAVGWPVDREAPHAEQARAAGGGDEESPSLAAAIPRPVRPEPGRPAVLGLDGEFERRRGLRRRTAGDAAQSQRLALGDRGVGRFEAALAARDVQLGPAHTAGSPCRRHEEAQLVVRKEFPRLRRGEPDRRGRSPCRFGGLREGHEHERPARRPVHERLAHRHARALTSQADGEDGATGGHEGQGPRPSRQDSAASHRSTAV